MVGGCSSGLERELDLDEKHRLWSWGRTGGLERSVLVMAGGTVDGGLMRVAGTSPKRTLAEEVWVDYA